MRGGDQYPVLIRKTEPKPLRVYLQDNNNDAWNPLFGDWFKSNIDMEAALNFAGYEVTNTWHAGGHEVKQATSIFADAMRWLWKGWPAAVKAGHSANDMLSTIAEPSEKWALSDTAIVTVKNSTLYNSILLPNGDAYLLKGNKLLFNQHKKNITLDEDANFGEALAISPGKDQLVVSIKNSHWLYNYIIDENGKVSDKQTLYWLHNPGNDDTSQIRTLAFDSDGNLYVATSIGVQVCDQNGRVRAILSLPGGTVTTLWFGGEGFNTLFAECGGKIYQRKLKIAGAPSQQKTLKPKSQGGG
jgi:hypothetical protein